MVEDTNEIQEERKDDSSDTQEEQKTKETVNEQKVFTQEEVLNSLNDGEKALVNLYSKSSFITAFIPVNMEDTFVSGYNDLSMGDLCVLRLEGKVKNFLFFNLYKVGRTQVEEAKKAEENNGIQE